MLETPGIQQYRKVKICWCGQSAGNLLNNGDTLIGHSFDYWDPGESSYRHGEDVWFNRPVKRKSRAMFYMF